MLMKKLVLLIGLVMVFVLSACSKDEKEDKIEIKEQTITLNLKDSFDLMEGVTGYLNGKKVTDEITVQKGTFSTYIEGDYSVVYQLGEGDNQVTNTRIIQVVDPLQSLPAPTLTNPDDLVIDFNNLSLTHQDLYKRLKTSHGINGLFYFIDRSILSTYENELTETEVNAYIDELKQDYTDQEWLEYLSLIGIMIQDGETLDDVDEEVYDYFKYHVLKKKAAIKRATKPEVVEAYKNAYVEDACVIDLRFNSIEQAIEELNRLSTLTTSEIQTAFENQYAGVSQDSDRYLDQQLACDYQKVSYQPNNQYIKLIYQDLEVGDYNTRPFEYNGEYHIVYKVKEAPAKSTYDDALFTENIKQILIDSVVTKTYIDETLMNLRNTIDVKIYDPLLAKEYSTYVEGFRSTEITNPQIIASYNGQDLTVDDYYAYLKQRYGYYSLLEEIKIEALLSIEGIDLKTEQLAYIDQFISQLKMQYIQGTQKDTMTLDGFIKESLKPYQLAINNERELRHYLKHSMLVEPYLIGNSEFDGVKSITNEMINDAIADYFHVKASHILFQFETDEEKAIAYQKAKQIINGVAEDEISYISFNHEPFKGLDHYALNLQLDVFGVLAKNYSEDTGSATNNGDLDYFKSGRMVEPFEQAILSLIPTGAGSYTIEPVESDFGYHVIYLSNIAELPTKPANYDQYSEAQILTFKANKQQQDITQYYDLTQEVKNYLRNKVLSDANNTSLLNDLIKTKQITFNDSILNQQKDLFVK